MEGIIVSIFFIIYGILGLFGIQRIPRKYRNVKLKKECKKVCGISKIIIGFSALFLFLLKRLFCVEFGLCLFLLFALTPGLIYLRMKEKNFKEDSLEEN